MTPNYRTAVQVGEVVANRLKARMADPRAIWGIPHAFKGLNKVTGGIHAPELTILTARPSVGKTTIMVQEADSVVEWLKGPVGRVEAPGGVVKLVLCESTDEVFFRRWACLRSGVSYTRIQSGKVTPAKAERFLAELRALARMPIEVLDKAKSLDEIVNFLTTGNTAWWALDYVQKCPVSPNRPNDGGVAAITLISGALTEVARRTAPGLALAHTPRDVDKREDRRPRMGDIKGGSALEGDARVVLGLYRDAIYQRAAELDADKPHLSELLVLKQNDGPVPATIELLFYPKRGLFEDISTLTEEKDEDD